MMASMVFSIAAETGWSEEMILMMPLAKVAQYQHCIFRRNDIRTRWSTVGEGAKPLKEILSTVKNRWNEAVDSDQET